MSTVPVPSPEAIVEAIHASAEAADLVGESVAARAERFAGVSHDEDSGQMRTKVEIWSDGLSLKQKIALEKSILGFFPGVTVYFKRRLKSPSSDPKPTSRPPAPFGVRVDRTAIPGVRHLVVVASGKGGVGKSTVSCNLAVALARSGRRVGLLDADIYGPSAPMMLGVSGAMPVAPGGKLIPLEAHGVKVVSFGFMSDSENPVIWRGPMVSKALEQLLYSTVWGDLDVLVVDLPPGTGDVQLTMIERLPIHGAVVVSTPQDVALLDAAKAFSMFRKMDVRVLGMVENMSQFVCPKCGHHEAIFGEGGAASFAEQRQVPVLARIPLTLELRRRGDAGTPAAAGPDELARPFVQLGQMVAEQLAL
jgi:ATP-binding protein involved in chromosome partitioning